VLFIFILIYWVVLIK